MAETVLVTGGNGFIGGWCIAQLLEQGYAVRTTVRSLSREVAVRAALGDSSRLTFCVADLTKDECWDAAMRGCDYVLHVASPLGDGSGKSGADFIGPARDGTLRVLRAAVNAGVKRVVMTSAAAAARVPKRSKKISDETVWADPADPRFDAYRRSKILAERAAWDFMASKQTQFATILPGAVFGPLLMKDTLGSVQIIDRMLHGSPAGIPKLGLWIVDVRDLADLHIRAMTSPEAAGQRFIAAGDFMWMIDVAKTLRAKLGNAARKVPRRQLSNFTVRLLSLFIPQLRLLTSELGRRNDLTSAKARKLLGFSPRPAAETIVDCAQSLLGFSLRRS
jgi:nucleoside-diphosphate-sugar epimerase